MWAAVGHKVRRLVRVAIGAYWLGDLAPGEWRPLDAGDLARLIEDWPS
jgi:16S rRNA pseudouridine516 synthase